MSERVKWVIDPAHSEIDFKIKHLMISNVKGVFKDFDAVAYSDGNDFRSAEVNIWINASSIDTGSADRDAHLKSADFLDTESYGQIKFKGNHVEKKGSENQYELWGDLTIKDVTNRIKLEVEFGGMMKDPWGNDKAGFLITGVINRKEWGLNWNTALETGGVLVGEEVKVNAEVQFKRASGESKMAAGTAEEKAPQPA